MSSQFKLCKGCYTQVEKSAKLCSNCGRNLSLSRKVIKTVVALVVIYIVISFLASVFGKVLLNY
jgi:predicted amidophosphoribosyltransferase